MKLTDLIKSLSLGAFIGCFTGFLVAVCISICSGPQNISFSGVDVINWFLGCIIIGWGFSISGLIYNKEDLALPFQVIFQMIIGFTVLFLVAIYLKWMPINQGLSPIILWIGISIVFGAIIWIGFYIYYYLLANDLNKKIAEK